MTNSIQDMLERDLQCEHLLDCFHGLKELDRTAFEELVRADGPLTVDELADELDRERSTAYRSVQRLETAGLVDQEQVNRDGGSYYHVYRPADADAVADEMQRALNDWYAEVGQLIGEFREKYATERPTPR